MIVKAKNIEFKVIECEKYHMLAVNTKKLNCKHVQCPYFVECENCPFDDGDAEIEIVG